MPNQSRPSLALRRRSLNRIRKTSPNPEQRSEPHQFDRQRATLSGLAAETCMRLANAGWSLVRRADTGAPQWHRRGGPLVPQRTAPTGATPPPIGRRR